ncbi:uncharacterized protein LOC130933932 [Arachis stenosperma]|uniref:uncharacterized protein LOC130933932 n=1 Tax=Arachis stenosperma TaxID=217475 RepID=UPI0025ABEFAC|nr:uncharacterized protein LOC130933932 [Arachis stenosperma]
MGLVPSSSDTGPLKDGLDRVWLGKGDEIHGAGFRESGAKGKMELDGGGMTIHAGGKEELAVVGDDNAAGGGKGLACYQVIGEGSWQGDPSGVTPWNGGELGEDGTELQEGKGIGAESGIRGSTEIVNPAPGDKGVVLADRQDDPCDEASEAESETSETRQAAEIQENREVWKLAVESGAVQYDEEDDIMAILQAQNEELARKKKLRSKRRKQDGVGRKIERRGLAGVGKLSMVKSLRKKFKLHMLGLIKTKKEVVTIFDIQQLWGNRAVRWEFVGSVGAAGGLVLMWDETVFKMNNCYKEDRWLCVEGVLLQKNFSCAFCLVYGPHDRAEKLVLWEELSFLFGLCQVPVCYLGDFNEIVNMEERRGATSLTVSAAEFKSWIQDMELVDLVISDCLFTWFRGQSCIRIDRVLASLEWLEVFPEIRLRSGPRGLSDHCPLIMETSRIRGGPRPFRSLDSWFTHEGFLRMVKEEWRSLGEVQFMDKLKALTMPLNRWHKEHFGGMDNRITQFEDEIRKVDDMVGTRVADGATEARRKALVSFCRRCLRGRRSNRIDALLVNGRLLRNQARIKIAIRDFYKELYHQEPSPVIGFRDGLVKQILLEEATELELMPTAEEIKEAAWDCESTKAPGSDGYNMHFIKKCWEDLGGEFTETVKGFFQSANLPSESNVTWVVLAPKFTGAREIKDLRLMSG